jgi:peptidoglycan hydrolase-like protein with peptidoglycan-binding domain
MTRLTDLHRTHPADAVVSPEGWHRLSARLEVTMLPLVDATTPAPHLFARLSQVDAEAACRAVGGRLPTRAEVIEALDASHLVPPVTLPASTRMASREWSERHDSEVRTMLAEGVRQGPLWPATPAWDRRKPAGNVGKHRVSGGDTRNERICGWRKKDGSLIQAGTTDIHRGEGPHRVDYATTTIAVRDPGISMPPSEPPPGPGAPMRPTIRLGSTGPHVGVWQRIVGATVDERFGPGTERATRVWQAARGLHADGIVGAQSWAAAGEVHAPPARHDSVSAPCRAAIRDANARWPSRRKTSDGLLGDAAHQQRPSDHNTGLAVDITHDPSGGCDGDELARLAIDDPRVTYVIWNRHIYNRARAAEGWRPYKGTNPHTLHCHISVREDARNDGSPWGWAP